MINKLSLTILTIGFCISAKSAYCQTKTYKFTDGKELTLSGRSETVHNGYYHRIDSSELPPLTKPVQRLAADASGLNLNFKTNSRSIKVKWTLGKYENYKNMTPIAINGLDLYGWNGHYWQYVAAVAPGPSMNTDSATLVANLNGAMRSYKLYLPLYSELKNIEIGVEKDAEIFRADSALLSRKKIVLYGSSITQGASASRPGMAYPSIIARKYNVETINLGFSGSGKIEPEIADVLAKMYADIYVLDCAGNPSPEQIKERLEPFVKRLRKLKPNVPIVMVESIFRESANWDSDINKMVTGQNQNWKIAFDHLKTEKIDQLYYIKSDELTGTDHETSVDGSHPSDIGQTRIADRIGKEIARILNLQPVK